MFDGYVFVDEIPENDSDVRPSNVKRKLFSLNLIHCDILIKLRNILTLDFRKPQYISIQNHLILDRFNQETHFQFIQLH